MGNFACCALRDGWGLNLATSESAICMHFAKQVAMAAFGIKYHDTFWCPRCPEELRHRSPRHRVSPQSETERRADARSAPKVDQVR
jgi:hypothetical protein